MNSSRPTVSRGMLDTRTTGTDRPASTMSQGVRYVAWIQCGLHAAVECITSWSETDLAGDLKRISMPALVVHGEDNQVAPINNSPSSLPSALIA